MPGFVSDGSTFTVPRGLPDQSKPMSHPGWLGSCTYSSGTPAGGGPEAANGETPGVAAGTLARGWYRVDSRPPTTRMARMIAAATAIHCRLRAGRDRAAA